MWEFACNDCDRVILAYTELSVLQEYREMPEIDRVENVGVRVTP